MIFLPNKVSTGPHPSRYLMYQIRVLLEEKKIDVRCNGQHALFWSFFVADKDCRVQTEIRFSVICLLSRCRFSPTERVINEDGRNDPPLGDSENIASAMTSHLYEYTYTSNFYWCLVTDVRAALSDGKCHQASVGVFSFLIYFSWIWRRFSLTIIATTAIHTPYLCRRSCSILFKAILSKWRVGGLMAHRRNGIPVKNHSIVLVGRYQQRKRVSRFQDTNHVDEFRTKKKTIAEAEAEAEAKKAASVILRWIVIASYRNTRKWARLIKSAVPESMSDWPARRRQSHVVQKVDKLILYHHDCTIIHSLPVILLVSKPMWM